MQVILPPPPALHPDVKDLPTHRQLRQLVIEVPDAVTVGLAGQLLQAFLLQLNLHARGGSITNSAKQVEATAAGDS